MDITFILCNCWCYVIYKNVKQGETNHLLPEETVYHPWGHFALFFCQSADLFQCCFLESGQTGEQSDSNFQFVRNNLFGDCQSFLNQIDQTGKALKLNYPGRLIAHLVLQVPKLSLAHVWLGGTFCRYCTIRLLLSSSLGSLSDTMQELNLISSSSLFIKPETVTKTKLVLTPLIRIPHSLKNNEAHLLIEGG